MSNVQQQHPLLNSNHVLQKPYVGISACLCGDNVRYDGRPKGLPALIAALEPYVKLQKICPEVGIGMGTPRDPIQLCNESGEIRALGIKNPDYDVTVALKEYARDLLENRLIAAAETKMPLCGYIFKSRSPSCGVGSTPIHTNSIPTDIGDGVFAQQMQLLQPWLPIVEEQDLADTSQQLHFVMLTQLVALFFNTLQVSDLPAFQNKTEKHRAQLPPVIQYQLNDLASSNDPSHYLTLLIKALQTQARK